MAQIQLKMKRHLHNSLRALFLSLAVLLSLPMLAEEVEIDGINYELVAKIKEATVIAKSSSEYSGEVVIPESVVHEGTTYSVTSIESSTFSNCSGLTSVTIPNSVTSIGEFAFFGCSSLASVHISDIASWCNIEFGDHYSNPFLYVNHLYLNGEEVKDLVIPNSVTSIGDYAFWGCSGLTSITMPNSVTSIGGYAFAACSGLTSIAIPNSVTNIGWAPFAGCKGLTKINVSEGNTTYDSREGCNAIIETSSNTLIMGCNTTVIPNSVTSIGDYAFSNCSGLTSIAIPNSVESIGDCAFEFCSGLTSVTIPNSVTSIGESAFQYCSGLTSVTIGNSVESIGERAFSLCSGLTSVTIGNSVESIGSSAFSDCSGLTSVTIPNSVESIGVGAFSSCSGLTSVTIGSGVNEIHAGAFANCPELLDVYCYAEKVPSAIYNAFDGSGIEYATLHVPAASIRSYKMKSPWRSFGNIVALTEEETGIDEVKSENANVKTAVYDLSGRRVQKAQKGIYIQNGKVMVK